MLDKTPCYRFVQERLTEDEYYDTVRSFLNEAPARASTVYMVDRGGRYIIEDPNDGRPLAPNVKGWDVRQFETLFKDLMTTNIIVRDRMGRLKPGEYSKQSFLKKIAAPLQAQTFKVIKGQKESLDVGNLASGNRPSLYVALLDNEWAEV